MTQQCVFKDLILITFHILIFFNWIMNYKLTLNIKKTHFMTYNPLMDNH